MSKINLLDIHIANLIAAGEVVERPSSALKELVENSIDAGATVITVEIKNGGMTYMRVTDNGEGMSAEDLGRSILRHSTSKIAVEDDLGRIKTLGFRGEALAAICSVADMKIFSRRKDSDTGYLLETSNGQGTKISEVGCAYGTTVIVERLFAKIPARQKFMKRDSTEGMYCKWSMEKIALSNPYISLRFIQDGKEKIFTPGGGSYRNAVYSIYKDSIGDRLIPIIETETDNINKVGYPKISHRIKVSGFVCRIDDCKSTRSDENFFVNGRYVRSKTILSAVEEAYDSVSEMGKFPICVLYITVDESSVDVNVHPQKMEVKFENEQKIFEAVYYTVKNTLEQSGIGNSVENDYDDDVEDNSAENMTDNKLHVEVIKHNFNDSDNDSGVFPLRGNYNIFSDSKPDILMQEETIETKEDIPVQETDIYIEREEIKKNVETEIKFETVPVDDKYVNDYKFIGEAFYGYIMVEKDEKIVIIDKHAAHERIIYDIMMERVRNNSEKYKTQILLIPVEIKLTSREMAGICEFKEEIEKIGLIFDLHSDDPNTILIKEVPSEISDEKVNIEDTVREMAYMLSEENNHMAHESAFEKLVTITAKKTAACRAAMKSGVKDEPEHLIWLADRALNYEGVKYCPHGRPFAFEMTKSQLEKQFGR